MKDLRHVSIMMDRQNHHGVFPKKKTILEIMKETTYLAGMNLLVLMHEALTGVMPGETLPNIQNIQVAMGYSN